MDTLLLILAIPFSIAFSGIFFMFSFALYNLGKANDEYLMQYENNNGIC